ncbi:uncharacterized protein MCYG_04939 [Microsporum canis CBS 113480]|uniref:Uncharacterized protein n=1 Tax=Arthroderma otae (strain ATCC MYA-4605 / CBS 113480) TaxID=554155 RepID=C5FQG7_ARTOC|nr:uncharacterized protein MCYG_04939 [Microsporum canis CBS 113480]EEQ32120.1 hypothetical protein MCYG_04939 [Microsporum canis CBS 113480]
MGDAVLKPDAFESAYIGYPGEKQMFKVNDFREAVEALCNASKTEDAGFGVRAAHIVPKSFDERLVTYLFGAEAITTDGCRNISDGYGQRGHYPNKSTMSCRRDSRMEAPSRQPCPTSAHRRRRQVECGNPPWMSPRASSNKALCRRIDLMLRNKGRRGAADVFFWDSSENDDSLDDDDSSAIDSSDQAMEGIYPNNIRAQKTSA